MTVFHDSLVVCGLSDNATTDLAAAVLAAEDNRSS
jgi:hypothetical protein